MKKNNKIFPQKSRKRKASPLSKNQLLTNKKINSKSSGPIFEVLKQKYQTSYDNQIQQVNRDFDILIKRNSTNYELTRYRYNYFYDDVIFSIEVDTSLVYMKNVKISYRQKMIENIDFNILRGFKKQDVSLRKFDTVYRKYINIWWCFGISVNNHSSIHYINGWNHGNDVVFPIKNELFGHVDKNTFVDDTVIYVCECLSYSFGYNSDKSNSCMCRKCLEGNIYITRINGEFRMEIPETEQERKCKLEKLELWEVCKKLSETKPNTKFDDDYKFMKEQQLMKLEKNLQSVNNYGKYGTTAQMFTSSKFYPQSTLHEYFHGPCDDTINTWTSYAAYDPGLHEHPLFMTFSITDNLGVNQICAALAGDEVYNCQVIESQSITGLIQKVGFIDFNRTGNADIVMKRLDKILKYSNSNQKKLKSYDTAQKMYYSMDRLCDKDKNTLTKCDKIMLTGWKLKCRWGKKGEYTYKTLPFPLFWFCLKGLKEEDAAGIIGGFVIYVLMYIEKYKDFHPSLKNFKIISLTWDGEKGLNAFFDHSCTRTQDLCSFEKPYILEIPYNVNQVGVILTISIVIVPDVDHTAKATTNQLRLSTGGSNTKKCIFLPKIYNEHKITDIQSKVKVKWYASTKRTLTACLNQENNDLGEMKESRLTNEIINPQKRQKLNVRNARGVLCIGTENAIDNKLIQPLLKAKRNNKLEVEETNFGITLEEAIGTKMFIEIYRNPWNCLMKKAKFTMKDLKVIQKLERNIKIQRQCSINSKNISLRYNSMDIGVNSKWLKLGKGVVYCKKLFDDIGFPFSSYDITTQDYIENIFSDHRVGDEVVTVKSFRRKLGIIWMKSQTRIRNKNRSYNFCESVGNNYILFKNEVFQALKEKSRIMQQRKIEVLERLNSQVLKGLTEQDIKESEKIENIPRHFKKRCGYVIHSVSNTLRSTNRVEQSKITLLMFRKTTKNKYLVTAKDCVIKILKLADKVIVKNMNDPFKVGKFLPYIEQLLRLKNKSLLVGLFQNVWKEGIIMLNMDKLNEQTEQYYKDGIFECIINCFVKCRTNDYWEGMYSIITF